MSFSSYGAEANAQKDIEAANGADLEWAMYYIARAQVNATLAVAQAIREGHTA